jgi:hypothetical protein
VKLVASQRQDCGKNNERFPKSAASVYWLEAWFFKAKFCEHLIHGVRDGNLGLLSFSMDLKHSSQTKSNRAGHHKQLPPVRTRHDWLLACHVTDQLGGHGILSYGRAVHNMRAGAGLAHKLSRLLFALSQQFICEASRDARQQNFVYAVVFKIKRIQDATSSAKTDCYCMPGRNDFPLNLSHDVCSSHPRFRRPSDLLVPNFLSEDPAKRNDSKLPDR